MKLKNEERFRNLWDNFKRSNIQIVGVPKGEQEEQETDNLFEQIMKENFLKLAKEIHFQEVQEAQSQRSWIQRSTQQGTPQLRNPRLKMRRESSKQQEKRRQLPAKEFP